MQPWQRRRHPLDVPTPVAVALSDFCRRAKAPAPAAQIRDALSALDESDDFRVREIADADVPATPLGPFAVVDMVMGTAAELACQREQTGYYELAKSMLREAPPPERDGASDAGALGREAPRARPSAPKAEPLFSDAKERRREQKRAASVAERIAPKKRNTVPAIPLPPEPKPSLWRRRELPKGKGRFTVVNEASRSIEELTKPFAKDELQTLLEQSGNRVALKRRLSHGFVSRRGKPLSLSDVEEAVERQGLYERMTQIERESILTALAVSRGAKQRAAQSLAMSPEELDRLVGGLKLQREVKEIRERFCREALSSRHLSSRLSMVARQPYLRDLGIERRFREALQRDLSEVLDRAFDGQLNLEALIDATAKHEGLKADQLEAAINQLGLSERYRERLTKAAMR